MPDDAAVFSALASLESEQTLGRYELLTPVGRGGMAVVWAARQKGSRGFSKLVALKMMLPHLSTDARFERMFLREAAIASRIDHPNVCAISDVGEANGILFLAMDWVDGDSLASVLTAAPASASLPLGACVRIVADAGRGLHAAHELRSEEDGALLGVVHRDVSPQNVLVTAEGAVKIVDFGVARAAIEQDQTTQSGFIKGKVAYVAPEQVNGTDVDARTDVFALGVLLYELTTRKHPFRRGSDLATLLAIASTDPAAPPSSLVPSYPRELERIVLRAIAKCADDRFASMLDFVVALDGFLQRFADRDDSPILTRILEQRRAERRRALRDAAHACDARRDARERAAREAQTAPVRAGTRGGRRTAVVATLAAFGALAAGVGIGATTTSRRSVAAREGQASASAANARAEPRSAPEPQTAPTPSAVAPAHASAAPSASSALTPRPLPSGRASPRPPPVYASASAPTSPTVSATANGPRFRDPGF